MKDGTGLGLRSGDSSGFCPSSCWKSDRSERTCTLPAGLEQKNMSHPRQEPRFKQNPSNFTTVIRSTGLTQQHCPISPAPQTQTCYPDQRPSHREEDNRLKTAACKQKWRPTEKHVRTRAPSVPSRNPWLSAQPFSYHKYKQSQRKSFTSSHSHVTQWRALLLSIPLYL